MKDINDTNKPITSEKMIGGITGKGFMPGVSGNPAGRPKKVSITESMKSKLERKAKDGKSNLANLVTKIFTQAVEGDTASQRIIWNYTDGLPEVKGKLDVDTTLNIVLTNYKTDVLSEATKVVELETPTIESLPKPEDTK